MSQDAFRPSGLIERHTGESETREPRSLRDNGGSLVTGSLGSLGSLVTPTLSTADVEVLGKLWGEDAFGTFPCPWPGHEAPASFASEDGIYMLACCSGHRRSLAEVWAARAYKRPVYHLSNIELATWWRRLAYDLGSLQPVAVQAPSLPPDAPAALHHARNGFLLLLGLRRVDHPPGPAAFSVRFAAACAACRCARPPPRYAPCARRRSSSKSIGSRARFASTSPGRFDERPAKPGRPRGDRPASRRVAPHRPAALAQVPHRGRSRNAAWRLTRSRLQARRCTGRDPIGRWAARSAAVRSRGGRSVWTPNSAISAHTRPYANPSEVRSNRSVTTHPQTRSRAKP
jgi:hypothetical protein